MGAAASSESADDTMIPPASASGKEIVSAASALSVAGSVHAQVLSATKIRESDPGTNAVAEGTELKMVLCVNGDLGMSKGKIAAQVGHAVLGLWLAACGGTNTNWLPWARAWNSRAAAKITLKIEAKDLDAVAAAAEAAGLPCTVIVDAGRTEIPSGSRTVVGIGPAPKELIDAVTGPKGVFPLKLLT